MTSEPDYRVAMEIGYFYVTPTLDAFTIGHGNDPTDVSTQIKVMTYWETEGTIYTSQGSISSFRIFDHDENVHSFVLNFSFKLNSIIN